MHSTETVETKVISDEAVAVRVRCCEDPSTDSWHVLQITGETSEKDIKSWHDGRHEDVKAKHAARSKAHSLLKTLAG
jgi:hypothetical protein